VRFPCTCAAPVPVEVPDESTRRICQACRGAVPDNLVVGPPPMETTQWTPGCVCLQLAEVVPVTHPEGKRPETVCGMCGAPYLEIPALPLAGRPKRARARR
jgi:hypothetical protein